MSQAPDREQMLWREAIANRPRHWVRLVTACNNKCLFCLDMDTPRNVYLGEDEVKAEILRGRTEHDAWKVVLSGGEASVHPLFPDFIRYAHEVGYSRVQTVTNGMFYGDKEFFSRVMDAGLNEITFSLHGHTAELHDHLVQTPGAFRRLIRGLVRALRDGRPIVNVDVVINQQNVAFIDKIVELAAGLGVREFDLLHVIPQSAAYDNRDVMFYDVREHLPKLQKVFQLNRHPKFVIWTNRFPVAWLEGLEDLIQDPHKMLDEVNGRRFMVRNYLDHGTPLSCRQAERCPHCFIEPFCTTMDRVMEDQSAERWQVWDGPAADELPFGCTQLALSWGEEPPERPLYVRDAPASSLVVPDGSTLGATTAEQLAAWLPDPPATLEVQLNRDTAAWLAANEHGPLHLHQPTWETMEEALEHDVADPRSFFEALSVRHRVSGLPACLAPGTELVEPTKVLSAELYDDNGRLSIRELARYHVTDRYRSTSVRCDACPVVDRCEGLHINAVRAHGLGRVRPLAGSWAEDAQAQLVARWPEPPPRLSKAKPAVAAPPSLPGHGPPPPPVTDPLANPNSLRRSDFLNAAVEDFDRSRRPADD